MLFSKYKIHSKFQGYIGVQSAREWLDSPVLLVVVCYLVLRSGNWDNTSQVINQSVRAESYDTLSHTFFSSVRRLAACLGVYRPCCYTI